MSSQTPSASLERTIDEAVERRLSDVHTFLPGKVVSVDVTLGLCAVQPLLKRKYVDGEVVEIPVISNVPIMNYRAGDAFISLPLKRGDYVGLLFSERSLDIWLATGGTVDPKDPRKFDISDAVAYPGIYPFSMPPVGADADNIVIRNGLGSLEITPLGKFLFQGSIFNIVDTLISLVEVLQAGTVADPVSGANPFTAATIALFENVKLQLQSLKK